MSHIEAVTIEGPDPATARAFYDAAFGLGTQVRCEAGAPSTGSRGFTLSLVVSQPSIVDLLVGDAVAAGANVVKPVAKSLWGYGGVLRAPDGAIWKVATSAKKDKEAATRTIDDVVLLLGCADVKASKRFYVEQGLTVKRSFGGKYAEFDAPAGTIKLALYGRKALAKDAGVDLDETVTPGLVIGGSAGAFTDPDGFAWANATADDRVAVGG